MKLGSNAHRYPLWNKMTSVAPFDMVRTRQHGVDAPPTKDLFSVVEPLEVTYKNRLYFAILRSGGKTTYMVTLVLDNCDVYEDVEESRDFPTEQHASKCMHDLKHLKTLLPTTALSIFRKY